MMTSMKQWATEAIGSTGFVWKPLVTVYAPLGLSSMCFNKHLRRCVRPLVPFLDPFVSIDIVINKSSTSGEELQSSNQAYKEVEAYLTKVCMGEAYAFYAESSIEGRSGFLLRLSRGQELTDDFQGVTVWWSTTTTKTASDSQETFCFRLMFPQKHRALIVDEYLPYVCREGRNIMMDRRGQRLYSNKNGSWSHINFEHPTTFESLAMHPDKKRKIVEDLDNFRRNEGYYRRIGKPWKRGYLIYGPPGTGKSSMIAAMAKHLKYDIYDMGLTSVSESSHLYSLLVEIPAKSIIVFEDIDCCFDDVTSQRSNQEGRGTLSRYGNDSDDRGSNKEMLSGLLNFIDGVWCAQTGERIIVFTTNFPDKLDQALIRSGRMDMHIEMSYCCFEAFQTLAMNYLGVGEHLLFENIKKLLQEVEITPADVAECLLRSHSNFAGSDGGVDMETCIGHLINELEMKAAEQKKRRLVPYLGPFVTIDIVGTSDNAYKEVEVYITKVCMRDAHAFCTERTVEGCSDFMLSLGRGQEVTDDFRGVTVWWLSTTTKTTTGRSNSEENPCYRLMFPQQHRAMILDEYLPHVRRIGRENLFLTIDIIEQEEVKEYLNSVCSQDAHNLYAEDTGKGDGFLFHLREGEEVADSFGGVNLRWLLRSTSDFRLVFPQQHRALILDEYLPHVRRQGHNIMINKQYRSLYSNRISSGSWSYINFEHPTTFETLAMHPDKKRKIMEDLDNFRQNEGYYRRIGKPWKRGYLLYGPPGTGKSTMIAAMANYLKYDIYDMELTSVSDNSQLRNLLLRTTGKAIIVFEDIDCCFNDVTGQRGNHKRGRKSSRRDDNDESKVTLSGLLNFIDGISSAETSERIFVLTTNFPDKLDEALTRSGRMDMRIEMSYCCFEAFQTLAKNYLGVEEHPLFQRVEELLQVVEITPADVAECFLRSQSHTVAGSDSGVETSIRCLIGELEKKAAQPQPKKQRRY